VRRAGVRPVRQPSRRAIARGERELETEPPAPQEIEPVFALRVVLRRAADGVVAVPAVGPRAEAVQRGQLPAQLGAAAAPIELQPFQRQIGPAAGGPMCDRRRRADRAAGAQFVQPRRFRREHVERFRPVELDEEAPAVAPAQRHRLVDAAAAGLGMARRLEARAARGADRRRDVGDQRGVHTSVLGSREAPASSMRRR
jgi:hypothetical protein